MLHEAATPTPTDATRPFGGSPLTEGFINGGRRLRRSISPFLNTAKMSAAEAERGAFVAGGVAGMAEAACLHPLDMVKTRHQLNTSANESIFRSVQLLFHEGGIPRLYRGLAPELVGMFATRAVMWGSYATAHSMLRRHAGMRDDSVLASLAGVVAGVPEAVVTTPFQLVKVRLQAKHNAKRYAGTIDCLVDTVRKEGPLALSHGLTATIWRNSVWNGVFFGAMHWMKDAVPGHILGFAAGWIATCFNAPFDVAKSRAQSTQGGSGGRGTLRVLYEIVRSEGPAAAYKGFWPKSLRMALGGWISAGVYRLCMGALGYDDEI